MTINDLTFSLCRNINAFLNTGKGGTLYMGILDDGTVKGIDLTQYQVSLSVHTVFAPGAMLHWVI